MKYHIRFAQAQDMAKIIDLCAAHAAYEEANYDPTGKAERLAQAVFAAQPKLYLLVVEMNEELVGYASYMTQYATWDAAEYVYMDCLYLNEKTRGQGIGEQMIRRIQEEAKQLGCTLIQWQTPDFNHRAIKFYKRIGGVGKTKIRFFLPSS